MNSETMSSDTTTPELVALNSVVRALKPLPPELRKRVIDSAMLLLGGISPAAGAEISVPAALPQTETRSLGASDVRSLKDQKRPDSANEMAALVAYYLGEVADGSERKSAVEIADMTKYFKQAQFRLPNNPKMILVNAKNAGYFDAAGGGQYKLNPVGYNLVVHSLPRTAGTSEKRSRSSKKRNPRKQTRRSSKK